MSFRSDAEILAGINKESYSRLTPRERQAKFRENVKTVVGFVIGILIAAVIMHFVIGFAFKPSSRDLYENSKNQQWQQQVAEYQKSK